MSGERERERGRGREGGRSGVRKFGELLMLATHVAPCVPVTDLLVNGSLVNMSL